MFTSTQTFVTLFLLSGSYYSQQCYGWTNLLTRIVSGNLNHHQHQPTFDSVVSNRREFWIQTTTTTTTAALIPPLFVLIDPLPGYALDAIIIDEGNTQPLSSLIPPVNVVAPNDATKKLFNEGRALESQGNMAAAQRIYTKVTQMAPKFIYGYSNLGNTQTALGDLPNAENSYTKSIELCNENLATTEEGFGQKRCSDLYVLLLNRGCIRLNNGMQKEALNDLLQAATLRGRPDAIVLQNLARAKEVNGYYEQADSDYNVAISMTANEVTPFWLRSALVKFQLNDYQNGFDILKRVENRFPEAPEVRAAYAVYLLSFKQDQIAAQRKFLEIPDRQRLKYSDTKYLKETISWPPKMIETISIISKAVGDQK